MGKFRSFIAVDPGVGGTGLAHWAYRAKLPHGLICLRPDSPSGASWGTRVKELYLKFERALRAWSPAVVYIEEPSAWQSPRGVASAYSGDLIKLAMLTGAYYHIASLYAEVTLVPVSRWKGQLPKRVVMGRIKRFTGCDYDKEHIADAVGIGIYVLRGRL